VSWTEGYVTDIGYSHGFCREMAPAWIAFALLLRGLRPPAHEAGFAFAELGAGQGFGTNLLAAANPQARFWANDFNPAHAAGAIALAEAGGLANLDFTDESFAEVLAGPPRRFDLIALHGVYSWISPENRAVLRRLLARSLKPGGAVYIGYNALPGWSAIQPLRRLMLEHAGAAVGPTERRIAGAVDFASAMARLNARFFAANPAAAQRLERLAGSAPSYLAHEYFNRDWHPLYFADVARELAEAKLDFAGSAVFADHLARPALPAEAVALLDRVPDALARETARDFFTNQPFRRDLFVRGAPPLPPGERRLWLGRQRFALVAPPEALPDSVTLPLGDLDLPAATYRPLVERLAAGPQVLDDLAAGTGLDFDAALEAAIVLCAIGLAAPALPAAGEATRREAAARFNAAVQDAARHGGEREALASPVLGGGVAVPRLELLFLLAGREGADPAAFALSILGPPPGMTAEAALDGLRRRAAAFAATRRPLLAGLGIA